MCESHNAFKAFCFLPHFSLRYFDTFAGIGGFATALNEFGHEAIGFSEILAPAIKTYSYHFPSHQNHGDITTLDPRSLADFDLLVGGFPCQAFSMAGGRLGFEDARGTLFFDLCRIAKAKRPRLLLFENVVGLLNHDSQRTFEVILGSLHELGYDVQWQVLDSRYFGVPYKRRRVFIVGHLRGTTRPEVFPLVGTGRTALGEGHACIAYHNCRRIATITDTVNTITRTYRGSPDGDGRPALIVGDRIRGLTPLECERLHKFPDGWTKFMGKGDRYAAIGNSVSVSVVREVVKRLG